jgi:hemoglobin
VFLSTDAAATGLNLQHASTRVNMDLPWNPALLIAVLVKIHFAGILLGLQSLRTYPMTAPSLCSEAEISELVRAFYARVREDGRLGPIFDAHVADWGEHLSRMEDFWSAVLLRTGRFSGSPMSRHAALPGLSADLFRHWLALFRETAAAQPNREMAGEACIMAERIAQNLWAGYQNSRNPGAILTGLAHG